MSNKQSSVEWFAEQTLNAYITKEKYDELLKQAKAMHKEEHRKTANDVRQTIFDLNYSSFDEYYNETFGGNNEQQ